MAFVRQRTEFASVARYDRVTMNITFTEAAVELVRAKGGVVALDFIPPLG